MPLEHELFEGVPAPEDGAVADAHPDMAAPRNEDWLVAIARQINASTSAKIDKAVRRMEATVKESQSIMLGSLLDKQQLDIMKKRTNRLVHERLENVKWHSRDDDVVKAIITDANKQKPFIPYPPSDITNYSRFMEKAAKIVETQYKKARSAMASKVRVAILNEGELSMDAFRETAELAMNKNLTIVQRDDLLRKFKGWRNLWRAKFHLANSLDLFQRLMDEDALADVFSSQDGSARKHRRGAAGAVAARQPSKSDRAFCAAVIELTKRGLYLDFYWVLELATLNSIRPTNGSADALDEYNTLLNTLGNND